MKINFSSLHFLTSSLLFVVLLSSSCSDDPQKENVQELITKVKLTFTPVSGPVVEVTATDPDGQGVAPIEVDGDIVLSANTTYVLTLQLLNELAQPTDPEYNITDEIEEEGDEHIFYFGWSGSLFADPSGSGNIGTGTQAGVNYTGAANSLDANNVPLGLTTTWSTSINADEGTFRVLLKHQPEIKSSTSVSEDGQTDLDISFTLEIVE